MWGVDIFMGRILNQTRLGFIEPGLVLEYLGIYQGQFVFAVYNRHRYMQGYTLLNI